MSYLCGPSWRSFFRVNLLTTVGVLWMSLCTCSPVVEADIIVTFGTSVPDPLIAGASGYVDVFAATNAGTQSLDGFQMQVAIAPGGGSPSPFGGLIFSAVQAEAQLGIGGPTGYVFFGNSLSQLTAAPIGVVSGGGSLYSGYDATFDFIPMTLTTTAQLLYRLNLDAVAAGTYDISVVGQGLSLFFADQLDPINSAIPFSSKAGGLTVTGAAAVPEPASTAFLIVSLAGVALRRRFRGILSTRNS